MPDRSDPPRPGLAAPGLLWAYAGSADAGTVRLSVDEIPAALGARDWVWVNVDLIDQRVHGWVIDLCGLPREPVLLADPDAGLELDVGDGEIHGVCADFNMDFLRVSDSIGRFGFSVSQRLLVTGWRHPLAGLDAARNALRAGQRHASAWGVLAAILAAFCRAGEKRLRAAEADLDTVEDQILAARPSDERLTLKDVRRLALALHRPVMAMTGLLREAAREVDLPPAGVEALEEMAERLAVLDQAVLHLSDRARLLQEEMAAELADKSNRSLRALTVMTGLLLPGSLVAGIFGMNTGGLPFQESLWGSLGAVLVGALATFLFYRILVRLGASLRF